MTQRTVTIKTSLDARQAAYFVQTASKFNSEIQVSVDERKINAKSIMGTIALNMREGQTATIIADGSDEAVAVEELAAVLC
ncbi:HPr family phosphocarrier protein [Anaerotignum sp. MB30-C6]|uniref:HPr family phosphocarrier protein n=1 Tax=Anaerotignum sp. MB30-C6 TaxID=3070814 RepID=UPI0027DEA494|nr:HPr family phosphocarrier protein [Anaerotignum sp. MB30-C6]WMI79840.1 HPr family phosphocarrier protein [Anaerotignum sp. MB30-C6]